LEVAGAVADEGRTIRVAPLTDGRSPIDIREAAIEMSVNEIKDSFTDLGIFPWGNTLRLLAEPKAE